MELYTTLETILRADNPAKKIENFIHFYTSFQRGNVTKNQHSRIEIFSRPSYEGFCRVVDQKEMGRRQKLGSELGQKQLLHTIAHIEYSAIDLALDAAYRFRQMEDEFVSDWLKVADDEIRHFQMIDRLLREMGSYYGEFAVHNALFEASMQTRDILDRMAVVPRYLEANGLDATPLILKNLRTIPKTPMVQKIIDALQIILDEEIDHVQRGDKWFHKICERQKISGDIYFEIIERYYPASFPRKTQINCEARRLAGFEPSELKKISFTQC